MKKISLFIFIMVNAITVVAFDQYDDDPRRNIDLSQPIKLTTEGIQHYLKNIYNNTQYATKVLSVDLSHLRQFIRFGIDTKQGLEYLKQILRLFRQKIMSCEFISGQEIAKTIDFMSEALGNFDIEHKSSSDKQVAAIKNVCYSEFAEKFEDFKKDPDAFLTMLSQKIYDNCSHDACEKETSVLQIRSLVIKFIETTLSKILWSPEDGIQVWEEFKMVGNALHKLAQAGIICSDEDLNDEIYLILSRFIYFLSLAGSELPQEFFDKAREDLAAKSLAWLSGEELEAELTPKFEILRKTLIQAQIRSQAKRNYGIIS